MIYKKYDMYISSMFFMKNSCLSAVYGWELKYFSELNIMHAHDCFSMINHNLEVIKREDRLSNSVRSY